MRTRRVRRRQHGRVSLDGQRRRRIPDLRPISERPTDVLDRAQPGHWEGDLIVGRYGRSHLITLVERHSRFLIVLPINVASSPAVIAALCQAFANLTLAMANSLTWDRASRCPATQNSADGRRLAQRPAAGNLNWQTPTEVYRAATFALIA